MRRVIGVAVINDGEVEAGNALTLQNREVGIVRQPAIDLDAERRARGDGTWRAHGPINHPLPGPVSNSAGTPPDPMDSRLMLRLQAARDFAIGHHTAAPIKPASSPSVTITISVQLRSARAASTRAASRDTATPNASSPAPGPAGTES